MPDISVEEPFATRLLGLTASPTAWRPRAWMAASVRHRARGKTDGAVGILASACTSPERSLWCAHQIELGLLSLGGGGAAARDELGAQHSELKENQQRHGHQQL